MARFTQAASLALIFTLAGCSSHHQPHASKDAFASEPDADTPAVVHKGHKSEQSLTLLHINDHHSHLDESMVPLMLDTGAGQRERIFVSAGGFARVASAMKALEAQAAGSVIKIHAGDAITGDLYYSLTHGQADADLMNTVCFDTFTLGNHEFDHGDAALKNFIDRLHAGNCRTRVLSANVSFGPQSALNPSRAPGYVQPSTIIERNGRRIGLVGITIADKTQNASRPDSGTVFLDEAQSAQAQIDELKHQGAEVIVLQTHYGYRNDLTLASRLRGVDVIIGGDSHTLLGPTALKAHGLTPMGPSPTHTTDLDGRPVCVAQAGHYAYVVGEIKLEFDDKGRLVSCQGRPHILIGDDFRRNRERSGGLNHAEIAAVQDDIARSQALRITPEDPEALAALAPHHANKQAFGSKVVAQVEETLCARRIPGPLSNVGGSNQGKACQDIPRLEQHGGDMQQMVAQAFLEQARQYFEADLALINAGGVRIDLPAGPLTVKDVHTLLPFSNTLVQLKVPGSVLKSALESALQGVVDPGRSTGAFPYVAGMRWQLQLHNPQGQRFTQIEVLDENQTYVPLDPDRIYPVATIDFIADGKDHYTPFAQLDDSQRMDVGLDATQLFLDYVIKLAGEGKGLRPLPTEHYSTQQVVFSKNR